MINDTDLAERVFRFVVESNKPVRAINVLRGLNIPGVEKKDINRVLYKLKGAITSPSPGMWEYPHHLEKKPDEETSTNISRGWWPFSREVNEEENEKTVMSCPCAEPFNGIGDRPISKICQGCSRAMCESCLKPKYHSSCTPKNNIQAVICLDGPIGGGKSVLIDLIEKEVAHRLDARLLCIAEPCDEFESSGMLQGFYDDLKNRSAQFQTFVFVTRMNRIREKLEEYRQKHKTDPEMVILERSIFTDRHIFVEMLLASGLMDDYGYKSYLSMWDFMLQTWDQILPIHPNAYLYLSTSLETCMERIASRNRPGENVSSEYQASLIRQHEKWLLEDDEKVVYQVDGNVNYKNEGEERESTILQVMDSLQEVMSMID